MTARRRGTIYETIRSKYLTNSQRTHDLCHSLADWRRKGFVETHGFDAFTCAEIEFLNTLKFIRVPVKVSEHPIVGVHVYR
jgi:hypothetical protein